MNSITEREIAGVDLKKLKKSIDAYSRSVGVRGIIIDINGEYLYDTSGNCGTCTICKKIEDSLHQTVNCSRVHQYGSYQAERFGGKYIFFCPMGLVHWASPITIDGEMRGAVLGGPVLLVEPEDFLIGDILSKNNLEESHINELMQYINEIPLISPETADSMSELLFMVAMHISDSSSMQYLEDQESLEQQSYISQYIHYIKTMGGSCEQAEVYPIEKEKELLSLIALGDKAGSQKVLNEIFGYIFFATGGEFEVIKARVLELVVLLSRAALEGGADIEQIFGLNYKFLSQIHSFKTVDELTLWLSQIMARFTDCVFNLSGVKHADVIYKSVDYIKRNYMKKISLEEVASHIYLSPSYFSKVFKDEMKCNFNTYLNNVRIDMSRKLLLDDSIALVDIASLVGYEDQSYFSKVFKKVVGVSPGKFRESRGNVRKTLV